MKTKMNIISCGGAGINITVNNLINLPKDKGYASLNFDFLDTTYSNMDSKNSDDPRSLINSSAKWKIESKSKVNNTIDGSGGERSLVSDDIKESIKQYLDDRGYKNKLNEIFFVIFSGSGGSGNVIGATLINHMIKEGMTVVPIVIADISSAVYTNNTIKTIQTLDKVARANKIALGCYYYNNSNFEGSYLDKQKAVDEAIFNQLKYMSIFLSGTNKDIDTQDMLMQLGLHKSKTINVPIGLYGLHTFINEVNIPKGITPVSARVLINNKANPDIDYDLLSNKFGYVDEALHSSDKPISLIQLVFSNFFNDEIISIKNRNDDFKHNMSNISNTELYEVAEEDDDEDLVF